MKHKTIAIGSDHAGFPFKQKIKEYLMSKGFTIQDYGTDSGESVDYPDFIHPIAKAVETGEAIQGIIFCGSGNGAAMTANKHQQIRAALCWTPHLAALARQHNNANVLSVPARFVTEVVAIEMVTTFLHTEFEGGRHLRRVEKIPND